MEWEYLLIALYLKVCQACEDGLEEHIRRTSPNDEPVLTDQEVITLFLFGIIKKRRQIKEIHEYAKDHLRDWFPQLRTYEAFNYRLNRLSSFFAPFSEYLLQEAKDSPIFSQLSLHLRQLDSMPIVLAKGKRANGAKVAREVASKGGHSSIVGGFHGLKLHAYSAKELFELLEREQEVELRTPVKKKKGQEKLFLFERLWSKSVSSLRQPIESFFNWIQEKTGIQMASKVRSTKGLNVHVWGRLAAAFGIMLDFSSI